MANKQGNYLFLVSLLIGILTMSLIGSYKVDADYESAISVAEKNFSSFNIKRSDYKLTKIENDILYNSEIWKHTYLHKSCLSKRRT